MNGDAVGDKIQEIEGQVIVWREMYDFGPLNLSWSKEEQIKRRAQFFEDRLDIPAALFIENCQNQNHILNHLPKTDEIVLWFEHDRYDQTMLMYLLTELTSKGFKNLSMVSINQYPGIHPFHGLGQLSSEQLLELVHSKKRISNEQIQEAITGWIAYNSANPDDLEKWIEKESHDLPFLLQVFKDHGGYFPSGKTGLNEVEFLALSFISKGTHSFWDLFKSISEKRINDGLSDFQFAAILNELMKGKQPLLKCNGPLPNYSVSESNTMLEITSAGLDVLEGRANRFDFVGIDWWVGGVHIEK